MGFTLEIGQETSTFRIDVEGMSSEPPILVEEEPATVGENPVPREEPTVVPKVEPKREAGQEDPVTPHLVDSKTRPMARSATKQGPSKEAQLPRSGQRRLEERGQVPRGRRSSDKIKK